MTVTAKVVGNPGTRIRADGVMIVVDATIKETVVVMTMVTSKVAVTTETSETHASGVPAVVPDRQSRRYACLGPGALVSSLPLIFVSYLFILLIPFANISVCLY
jgi:hypothetical protein